MNGLRIAVCRLGRKPQIVRNFTIATIRRKTAKHENIENWPAERNFY